MIDRLTSAEGSGESEGEGFGQLEIEGLDDSEKGGGFHCRFTQLMKVKNARPCIRACLAVC